MSALAASIFYAVACWLAVEGCLRLVGRSKRGRLAVWSIAVVSLAILPYAVVHVIWETIIDEYV